MTFFRLSWRKACCQTMSCGCWRMPREWVGSKPSTITLMKMTTTGTRRSFWLRTWKTPGIRSWRASSQHQGSEVSLKNGDTCTICENVLNFTGTLQVGLYVNCIICLKKCPPIVLLLLKPEPERISHSAEFKVNNQWGKSLELFSVQDSNMFLTFRKSIYSSAPNLHVTPSDISKVCVHFCSTVTKRQSCSVAADSSVSLPVV